MLKSFSLLLCAALTLSAEVRLKDFHSPVLKNLIEIWQGSTAFDAVEHLHSCRIQCHAYAYVTILTFTFPIADGLFLHRWQKTRSTVRQMT